MAQISSALRRCCLAVAATSFVLLPVAGSLVHPGVATVAQCNGGGCTVVGPFRPGGGDPSGGNDRARPGNDTFPRGTHIFPDNAPSSGVLNSNLPSSVIPHGLSQQPGMSNVAPNNTPAPETSVSPEETSPDNLV